MKIKTIILLLPILLLLNHNGYSCTTGLASPRVTAGNRALLWKNRDSSHEYNAVNFYDRGKFKVMGIINSGDTTQIWAGVNNFGFAIINAEARDMARKNENTRYDDEGILMKEALMRCKTVDDFEEMLKSTNQTGRAVTSNFGVMDANGKVAYFETGNYEYFKFSGNDLFANPEGYLVRSNFALRGNRQSRYGLERYLKAFRFFEEAKYQGKLSSYYLLKNVSPDISYSSCSGDYQNIYKSINRKSSVSAAIFEGILKQEDAELTTFWCNIGEPALSVAVPIWVYAEEVPQVLNMNDSSAINHLSLKLEDFVYSDTSRSNSIFLPRYQKVQDNIRRIQQYVIRRTRNKLTEWRADKPARSEVAKFQKEIATKVYRALKNLLDEIHITKKRL